MSAIETFIWPSHGEIKHPLDTGNTRVSFDNGEEQVQRNRLYPIETWEFTVSDTYETLLEIQQFFKDRFGGMQPFYWTDKHGVKHIVRLADKIEFTEIPGILDNGKIGIVGYNVTIQIRKVRK